MGWVDDFLTSAADEVDAMLGTVTMVCNGQTFAVVVDDVAKSESGEDMGLTGDYSLIAVAQAADVTEAAGMINRRATVDGATYRVSRVRIGTVAIHFELQDPATP
jgi:hypothetical protein